MLTKTLTRTLAIALAATLGFAGVTACDSPEEADEPVSEQTQQQEEADETAEEEDEPDEAQQAQLEAPDELAIDGPGDPMAGDQHPMAGGPPEMDGEVSDEDLDNFADAITALEELEQDADGAQARMMEAETPEEQMQVLQELMQEAEEAVEDTGMDLMGVEAMARRIQFDEDLQERVDDHDDLDLQQLMGPPQGQQQPPAGGPGQQPPAGGPAGDEAPQLDPPEIDIE